MGLPMDVTNQAQTSKIYAGTPETEKAYKDSLKPTQAKKQQTYAGTPETEKAYQDSFSQKGKPPPGLSDRSKAQIADGSYRKRAESLDARRNQLQQNIDTQKAKPYQSPNIHTQIAQTMKRRRRQEMPRFALPSKDFEDKMAQKQLADIDTKRKSDLVGRQAKEAKNAKDQAFIASAKSSNKKAKEALAKHEQDAKDTEAKKVAEQKHNTLVNSPAYRAQQDKSMASINYKKPVKSMPPLDGLSKEDLFSWQGYNPNHPDGHNRMRQYANMVNARGGSKNNKPSSSLVEAKAKKNLDPYSKYGNRYAGGVARRQSKTKQMKKDLLKDVSDEFKRLSGWGKGKKRKQLTLAGDEDISKALKYRK
jgi:hypothetical protein